MKLEDKCATLEQSKRIKKLLGNPDVYSEHYWVYNMFQKRWYLDRLPYDEETSKVINAFDVAELGQLITNIDYDYLGQISYTPHATWMVLLDSSNYETEAQARAAILIHLLEHGAKEL